MAIAHLSAGELRSMPLADLLRECDAQSMLVSKMRIGIELKKEKDTARYCRERKVLARMETVLTEKKPRMPMSPKMPLKKAKKSSTLKRS